jgi:hypothetical protein
MATDDMSEDRADRSGADRSGADRSRADRFDPRFDPAFQRGFDAVGGAAPATRAQQRGAAKQQAVSAYPAHAAAASSSATAYSGAAYPGTAYSGAAPAAPPSVGLPPVVSVPVQQPGHPEDGAADAPGQPGVVTVAFDAPPLHRNPFVIGLALVSVLLVVAGIWGVQAARDPFLRTDVAINTDFVGLQILATIAPVSIVLGIATAIGIGFLFAVDWQRRSVAR